MLYSKLGNTGLIVSRLSLGTMTFGTGGGNQAIAKTGPADADAFLGRAIEGGINFIDTADVYSEGQSEEMLGAVLGTRRHDLVLATKAGWRSGEALNRSGLSANHLHRSIDESLARLRTDHVDIYIAHRSDANTPLEETLVALDVLESRGAVRPSPAGSLRDGYRFLRRLEQRARVVHGARSALLEESAPGLTPLARSMGYRDGLTGTASEQLMQAYRDTTSEVRGAFLDVVR